jgi:sorbitol-specific phosphotransferase system component IIA
MDDESGAIATMGNLDWVMQDVSAGTEDSSLITRVMIDGAVTAVLNVGSDDTDLFLELGNSVVIKFEGATGDAFETLITVVDPTASDKTITFPNETGTVCTTGSVCAGYTAGFGKEVIYFPASSMKANVTSPASCGDTYDSGTNDLTLPVCAFDTGATEERADFSVYMPQSWNEGTVTYQAIWTNTGGSAAQTVQWEVGCVAISDDDPLNVTIGTTVTQSDTFLATNDVHITAESSAVTCAGTIAAGDLVVFRISRDTSVDNMAGDALLIGLKVFYTSDAAVEP